MTDYQIDGVAWRWEFSAKYFLDNCQDEDTVQVASEEEAEKFVSMIPKGFSKKIILFVRDYEDKMYKVYCTKCGKLAGVVKDSLILGFSTTNCIHCGKRIADIKNS